MCAKKKFFKAFKSGDLATIIDTVSTVGVNYQDKVGITALMVSIFKNQMAVFNYLLSLKDLDINIVTDNGSTALHVAVYHKKEEAARALVARDDVDMTSKNAKGETAKESAVAWKYHGLVAILEEAEVA